MQYTQPREVKDLMENVLDLASRIEQLTRENARLKDERDVPGMNPLLGELMHKDGQLMETRGMMVKLFNCLESIAADTPLPSSVSAILAEAREFLKRREEA